MRELSGVVIGAGNRGSSAYAPYLLKHPEQGRIGAVAEPNEERRLAFAARYSVSDEAQFNDWSELLARPKLADFALIATGDAEHVEPAIAALERGYHVLLEKPMATSEPDCERLVRAAASSGRILQICHVMRYAPLFEKLATIVHSGELGRIITIQHSENVSYWHYAHSYCRGHWRNVAQSSPMILAKSCHDLDLLYWLAGAEPERLVSLGRPTELCAANKPVDAPLYCIDGCAHASQCPYDAVAMYLDGEPMARDLALTHPGGRSDTRPPAPAANKSRFEFWPVSTITDDHSRAGVEAALRTTRWGRCVYQIGDNDQVSSQTVNVLFRNGVNASFTMHSTSHREGRETRIDGTRGSARGLFYALEQSLEVTDHKSGITRDVPLTKQARGHGGGDWRLFADFLEALRGKAEPLTTATESLQSHRMAFAAERAMRGRCVVEFDASG